MTYFKNVELAKLYNISESTVRNWIKMAKEGKIGLILHATKGHYYIANIASNVPIIENLIEENRKYRNSLASKTIEPNPRFYRIFDPKHVHDIVRNLEINREIPRFYNFFDEGADLWDDYATQLAEQPTSTLLNQTVNLLHENCNYLDARLKNFQKVNIIDIGVGNVLPAKGILTRLLAQGRLNRYIAIDISRRMLQIAERNVKEWFEDRVTFESHQFDITHERFSEITRRIYSSEQSEKMTNLVLLLGATPSNFRHPDDAFRTIRDSMNPRDLLLYTDKIETLEMHPEWFEFEYDSMPKRMTLSPRHRLVIDLLNIDERYYDVEMGFDADKRQRYVRARLKVALTLKFDFEDGERALEFEKGDTILLWRSWQMTAGDVAKQFDENGFYVLHSSQTEDHEYIMTVAEVKRDL